MNVLDLFSGIGGFSLGLERAGMTTVAFCEVDPWCRRVLAKHWPDVPCFDDVRTLKGEDVGSVQLICGGYPCTPFSQAGKRRGAEDDRHLWPEMFRIIKDIRPAWVICENVAGHISMGLDDVLSDLEGEGYACQAFVVGAVAVDSPHRRQRVWVVAHSEQPRAGHQPDEVGLQGRKPAASGGAAVRQGNRKAGAGRGGPTGKTIPNADAALGRRGAETRQLAGSHSGMEEIPAMADNIRIDGERQRPENNPQRWQKPHGPAGLCSGTGNNAPFAKWQPEPGVGRVAHGVPRRVDRLKGLGNAVVPQIPEMIGRAIMAVGT